MNKFNKVFLAMMLMGACSNGPNFYGEDMPGCIREKISGLQDEPVRNPPASVTQYQYKGHTVYYIPPSMGDQMSQLYNEDCQLVCRPDGGITGSGDGKCPDFFDERTEEKIIWKDERK